MDLVAGDVRDIVLALAVDDMAAFDDPDRFVAHLPLGGGLDPTWLDLFSEAVRSVTGSDELEDFLDARSELEGAPSVERIVDRVDPAWIEEVAQLPDEQLGALAGRWIELLEEELGLLPREEKPWIRDLAGRIVAFCGRPPAPGTWSSPGPSRLPGASAPALAVATGAGSAWRHDDDHRSELAHPPVRTARPAPTDPASPSRSPRSPSRRRAAPSTASTRSRTGRSRPSTAAS